MAEPILNAPCVVASIGRGIAAGMPEHVGVDRKGEARSRTRVVKRHPEGDW
jgi:hypothetical protein